MESVWFALRYMHCKGLLAANYIFDSKSIAHWYMKIPKHLTPIWQLVLQEFANYIPTGYLSINLTTTLVPTKTLTLTLCLISTA